MSVYVEPVTESNLEERNSLGNDGSHHKNLDETYTDIQSSERTNLPEAMHVRIDERKELVSNNNYGDFNGSRGLKIEELLKEGKSVMMSRKILPEWTNGFGSRIIDEVKKAGDSLRTTSLIVAQIYQGRETAMIATKAATVQRYAQLVLLSVAASDKKLLCALAI